MAASAPRTRPRFAPPRSPRAALRRARLDDAIVDGIETGVLFLVAPAGYGKTTVITEWLARSGLPVAWLSLTTAHRDPLTLLGDMIEALAQLHPAVEALRAQLLAGDGPQGAGDQQAALLAALEDADDFAVFVLDDLHALQGAEASSTIIDELCAHPPGALGLVLMGRERPDFPSLARGVASGRMALIDARTLAFTDDEARALLDAVGAPEAARTPVLDRAQGWPLALALLGRRALDAPPRGDGAPQIDTTDLDEFVRSEVFDPLPPDDRALLQACAVGAYFDGDIAAEVSGRADSAVALQRLQVRTGLIGAVGDGRWLRMHALLREYCLQRLAREDPAGLAAYRARAARALRRLGELDEATELALDAESWADARDLIEVQAETLSGRGAWPTLASWLGRLPQHVLDEAPDLALLRARVAIWLMRLAEAHSMLDELEPRLRTPRDQALALLYRGVAFRQARRLDDALRVQRRARALIDESEPAQSLLRVEADVEEGTVLGMRGELGPSVVMLERAADAAQSMGHMRFGARAHGNLGMALQFGGQLAAAGEAFRESRRRWEHLGERNELLRTLNNEATSAHILGDLDAAEAAYRRIIDDTGGGGRFGAFGYLGLADIARDRGFLDEADTLYREATGRASGLDLGAVETAAAFGLAMVQRERGDLDGARARLEHHLRLSEEQGAAEFASRCGVGLAAVLVSEQRYAEARQVIRAVLQGAGRGFLRRQLALLVSAEASFGLGEHEQAAATLRELVELVDELGYDAFLLAEARLAADLLETDDITGPAAGYFRRLLTRARNLGQLASPSAGGAPGAPGRPGAPDLIVRGFGPPSVVRTAFGDAEVSWRSERSMELLLLLVTRDAAITRPEAETALWPEAPAEQLSSLFHNTLHRLRRSAGEDVVLREHGRYRVNPELRVDFDVRRFEVDLAAAEDADARGDAAARAAALRSAIALRTGSFAQGFTSEWTDDLRARLDDRYVAAALTLARLDIAEGNYAEAVGLAEAVLNLDPLDEEAVRHLIAAHVGMGFPDLALRAYRRLQDLTERDLGAQPSMETRRALEAGLAHLSSAPLGTSS